MSDIESTSDSPTGFQVLPESDWKSHSWLSQLDGASDMEMDSAMFWTGLNQKQIDALKQILVQYRLAGKAWENAPHCENASFPGREWGQASWGWYRPFFTVYGEYEMRALIPDGWISPEFDEWQPQRPNS
jgi:hypothetical protein